MKRRILSIALSLCMITPTIAYGVNASAAHVDGDWANGYIDIVNAANDDNRFALCYIDRDDRPELVVVGSYNAEGSRVYTADDRGNISSVNCSLNGITYVERENLMCDSGGSMDVYYDDIYHIENGEFVRHYRGTYGAPDNSNVQIDSDGNPIYNYYWDDGEVPENDYYLLFYTAYPMERAQNPYDKLMTRDQIVAAITELQQTEDTSNLLSPENISYFKRSLCVPDNLDVQVSVSDRYYWAAGERWLVQVSFTLDGEIVAGAAFDADNLEMVRDILMYSGEQPATTEVDIEQLKNDYIEQHISYYNDGYGNDMVSLESMAGMGYVMDDIDGDLSTAIYKGLSVATAGYSTVSDFLNISSYFDLDLGEAELSLKIPDQTITSIGHSEYEAILYQLMASDAVYNGILETFALDYEDNVRGFVKEIANEFENLAKANIKNNTAELSSLQEQMQSVAESVGSADEASPEFQDAVEQFEALAEQYLDISQTKDLLKNLTTTADVSLTFFGQLFDGIQSIGEAYQYACWAESYAKTSEAFKTVLSALRDEAYQNAWGSYGLGYAGEHDPLIAYSRENMYMGLYEAVDSFVSNMEAYQEDTHRAFLNEVMDAAGGGCAKVIVGTMQDGVVDQLGGAVCPELGAINTVLSSGKLLVDLFTGVDDEYTLALAVESLDCITSLLTDISDHYGESLVNLDRTGSYIDLNMGSQLRPVTVDVKFEAAAYFCKSIQMYKNAVMLACDYGSRYVEAKRQTSETSSALSFLAADKLKANDIQCHDSSLDQAGLFSDVSQGSYYADAVLWAVREGITSGTSENTFSPDQPCTRAEAVTFLWRANGSPNLTGSGLRFSDVPNNAYYYGAAQWAIDEEITFGVQSTSFAPNVSCSRAQIATFIYRAAGSPEAQGSNSFSDVEDDVYYTDAINWITEQGIATGTGENTFSPNEPCTRAQIVAFLYRAEEKGVF